MTDQAGEITQTNPQRSMSQKRGNVAWDCIQNAKVGPNGEKYLQVAKSAAADIQVNGLGQTLAFWKAKGQHYAVLLENLSGWLSDQNGIRHPAGETIQWIMHTATTAQYRRATSEAIAFLIWLRRFAEAEKVE
jgi:CRISPR-associated protein Cmr5